MTVVWLTLLHYYTSFSGFLAYCFIAIKKTRISKADFIFLFGLAFLTTLHFLTGNASPVFLNFRYYWGWVFFYFIFKGNIPNYKIFNSVLVTLSVLTLVEATLVNTVITTSMLPNFPSGIIPGTGSDGGGSLSLFGAYQRPFSFGGIAPVGAPLLVALMAFCQVRGWRFWLSTLAVLSLVSGTGTYCLLILLLARHKALLIKAALPLCLILLIIFLLSSEALQFVSNTFAEKVSLGYLSLMVNLMWEQTIYVLGRAETHTLFIGFPSGSADISGHGGDWGILSFASTNGIFGFLLLLLMIFYRSNRSNRLPLFIILTASIHYAAMCFLPGQMILGLLLSSSKSGLTGHEEQAPRIAAGNRATS